MTLSDRLEQWEQRGAISPEQRTLLADLSRGVPMSLFLELNLLLYVGVLAFVAGLGWTATTWSEQLGDVLILATLTAGVAGCLWYCFSKGPAWSAAEIRTPHLIVDYVLYLGTLLWSAELAYIEARFHLFQGQWDLYLFASAGLFFILAYRFDNRFVLSLALSTLAAGFGLTLSRYPSTPDEIYRQSAVLYSGVVGSAAFVLRNQQWKQHFFYTYLNIAANVLFWAILSGVFQYERSSAWLIALLVLCAAALFWGIRNRQFLFVAYGTIYGYIGISYVFIRGIDSAEVGFFYFAFTGIAVVATIVRIALLYGREP